jgi:UMF1 family MFS transporter
METRKNVFLWILYDFANSIVSIVFFLYFAQWIVVDKGVSDLYFNLTFTVSALLLLFTVPLTGLLLDKFIRRISGLRLITVSTVVFYGLCALSALSNNETAALILFTLGLYSYLLSFTFYTPLINDIVSEKRRGLISGIGVTANYIGQFAGLLIALPFSKGALNLFNGAPRAETLLPAIVIFFMLSLPMLVLFKEPKKPAAKVNLGLEVKNLFKETRGMLGIPSVAFFLASFFLFNDAVLTAANNFPIFMEQVWHVSDTAKTYILLSILITSSIGGTLSGFLADRFGHKRTLMFVVAGWIFIMPILALITNFIVFLIFVTIMGFWFGANWAVSRSVMSYIAPKGKHNLAFAYYGLAERASSFIGPIIWGIIVSNLVYMGSYRYRIAVVALTVFVILGLFALSKIRDDRKPVKS